MSNYKRINDVDVGDDFVLPEGSILRGQLLFKKHCSQCHTIRRDGMNPYGTLAGPNLYGVMGRTAAQNQRSGWSKYSVSLEESGILWTDRNMVAFLKNPRAFAGGAINMNFRGIDSFRDRVDLVHYLKRAGHESWMVQDGTPHSQRKWWTRGQEGRTQSYWVVHADEKQLKPWQHLTRYVSEKARDTWNDALASAGFDPTRAGDSASSAAGVAAFDEADDDLRNWRRVKRVEDGVKPASLQQSFNWPPREVISDGPIKMPKPPPRRAAPSAGAATGSAPPEVATWTAPAVACEAPPPPPLADGWRAPSGLMVYREGTPTPPAPPPPPRAAAAPAGSPPTAPPPAAAARAAPAQAAAVAQAAAPPPGRGAPPADAAARAFARPQARPDGGVVTPGGLVSYAA